jgi:hypothetical protein
MRVPRLTHARVEQLHYIEVFVTKHNMVIVSKTLLCNVLDVCALCCEPSRLDGRMHSAMLMPSGLQNTCLCKNGNCLRS